MWRYIDIVASLVSTVYNGCLGSGFNTVVIAASVCVRICSMYLFNYCHTEGIGYEASNGSEQ